MKNKIFLSSIILLTSFIAISAQQKVWIDFECYNCEARKENNPKTKFTKELYTGLKIYNAQTKATVGWVDFPFESVRDYGTYVSLNGVNYSYERIRGASDFSGFVDKLSCLKGGGEGAGDTGGATEDTFASVEAAPAAGTDNYGNAYEAGATVITFADGSTLCIAKPTPETVTYAPTETDDTNAPPNANEGDTYIVQDSAYVWDVVEGWVVYPQGTNPQDSISGAFNPIDTSYEITYHDTDAGTNDIAKITWEDINLLCPPAIASSEENTVSGIVSPIIDNQNKGGDVRYHFEEFYVVSPDGSSVQSDETPNILPYDAALTNTNYSGYTIVNGDLWYHNIYGDLLGTHLLSTEVFRCDVIVWLDLDGTPLDCPLAFPFTAGNGTIITSLADSDAWVLANRGAGFTYDAATCSYLGQSDPNLSLYEDLPTECATSASVVAEDVCDAGFTYDNVDVDFIGNPTHSTPDADDCYILSVFLLDDNGAEISGSRSTVQNNWNTPPSATDFLSSGLEDAVWSFVGNAMHVNYDKNDPLNHGLAPDPELAYDIHYEFEYLEDCQTKCISNKATDYTPWGAMQAYDNGYYTDVPSCNGVGYPQPYDAIVPAEDAVANNAIYSCPTENLQNYWGSIGAGFNGNNCVDNAGAISVPEIGFENGIIHIPATPPVFAGGAFLNYSKVITCANWVGQPWDAQTANLGITAQTGTYVLGIYIPREYLIDYFIFEYAGNTDPKNDGLQGIVYVTTHNRR